MDFYKTIYKHEIVFTINEKTINDSLVEKIISETKQNQKIGIDMKNVESVNSQLFTDYLLQNKFRLFNPKSEILVYLAIILKDGFLKSHINYKDFSQNKRELIRRKFIIAA